MGSIVNNIKNALINNIHIDIDSYNKQVSIKEKDRNSRLKKVTISGIHDCNSIFVFSLDIRNSKYSKITPFLKLSHINERCDGIIYYYFNNIHYFILCELKSGDIKGYKNQIKSSEAFVNYLLKAIELFDNIEPIENIRFIRILFKLYNINKGPTKIDRDIHRNLEFYPLDCKPGEKSYFHINKLINN